MRMLSLRVFITRSKYYYSMFIAHIIKQNHSFPPKIDILLTKIHILKTSSMRAFTAHNYAIVIFIYSFMHIFITLNSPG